VATGDADASEFTLKVDDTVVKYGCDIGRIVQSVKAGEQWADTSAKATTSGTDSVVVKRVTSYRVVGKDTRESRNALRVSSEYSSTVAGTQPTPNGPARIEGAGKGTGSYFVSPEGLYLGGDWQLRSSLTISGVFANEPLPITITQTTKVTALP